MTRFIIKKLKDKRLQKKQDNTVNRKTNSEKITKKNKSNMDTSEKVKLANEILDSKSKVKKLRKDKDLIERMESTKTILTEDNKELLRG